MPELIEKSRAEPAFNFKSVDAAGRNVKLSDYKGKAGVVLVLNRGFG